MINNYAKGGLKMLDIQGFNESLKMKWIQGYLNEENKGKWNLFLTITQGSTEENYCSEAISNSKILHCLTLRTLS